jgi:serine/threonine protein kinase
MPPLAPSLSPPPPPSSDGSVDAGTDSSHTNDLLRGREAESDTVNSKTLLQPLRRTDVRLLGEIGRGLTTVLFAGTIVATGKKVAIKKPLANVVAHAAASDVEAETVGDQCLEDVAHTWQEEVALMQTVGHHPNICKFIGACLGDTADMFLCYEYLGGGSLSRLVMDRTLPMNVNRIAVDVAAGMQHLHSVDVLHRDLKSGNIMLDSRGRAKLCDFGLSCFIRPDGEPTAETGTYRWMAPEVIRHEKYSFPADVYSFGIVLWEMCARARPFDDLSPIQAAFGVAKNNLRPTIPSHMSPTMKALLTRCWHPNPTHRPTFKDILLLLSQLSDSAVREVKA